MYKVKILPMSDYWKENKRKATVFESGYLCGLNCSIKIIFDSIEGLITRRQASILIGKIEKLR